MVSFTWKNFNYFCSCYFQPFSILFPHSGPSSFLAFISLTSSFLRFRVLIFILFCFYFFSPTMPFNILLHAAIWTLVVIVKNTQGIWYMSSIVGWYNLLAIVMLFCTIFLFIAFSINFNNIFKHFWRGSHLFYILSE